MRGVPVWTAVVIGILFGMLLGAAWLLGGRFAVADRPLIPGGRDTVVVREVVPAGGTGEALSTGRRNAVVLATEKVASAVVSRSASRGRSRKGRTSARSAAQSSCVSRSRTCFVHSPASRVRVPSV